MVNRKDGTSNDDTLTGTSGEDSIRGRSGDDSIEGGDGNDTLKGESGDDTLKGGAGDDSLEGGSQDDLLLGGEGDDTLEGDSGDDTLEGGAGDDLIDGASQDDQIWGDVGDDTILGGSNEDLLSGGQGDDSLDGGSQDDSLFGGFGDDTLIGGTGDDWLEGGAGDDLIDAGGYSGGSDTIVFGPGFGNDTIDGFNPTTDFVHIGGADPDDVTFSQTSDPKIWVLTLDGQPNESLTLDFTHYWNSNLQASDLQGRVLTEDDTPIPEDPYAEPICLTARARVETARGLIPAMQIVEGDWVRTLDAGWQRVRAVLRKYFSAAEMAADPSLRPVHIPRGAFGDGLPWRDMTVSLQHGFLAEDPGNNHPQAMIRARHLADMLHLARLAPDAPSHGETYVHLLLEAHHLILAEGVWTETVFTGPRAVAGDAVLRRMVAEETLPVMSERARPLLSRRALRAFSDYRIGQSSIYAETGVARDVVAA